RIERAGMAALLGAIEPARNLQRRVGTHAAGLVEQQEAVELAEGRMLLASGHRSRGARGAAPTSVVVAAIRAAGRAQQGLDAFTAIDRIVVVEMQLGQAADAHPAPELE